jgi:hypothetical protein
LVRVEQKYAWDAAVTTTLSANAIAQRQDLTHIPRSRRWTNPAAIVCRKIGAGNERTKTQGQTRLSRPIRSRTLIQ